MTRLSIMLLVLLMVGSCVGQAWGQDKPPGALRVYLPYVERAPFEVGPVRPGSPTPTATPIVPPPWGG